MKFRLGEKLSLMCELYQGDCLEIMKDITNKSIDMILTDPSYGTTACKWDSIISLESMWKESKRLIKDNGIIVLTASQPFTTVLIGSNMEMFKYTWVWDKVHGSNFLNLKNRPWKNHEDIVIFSQTANFTFNPIPTMRSEKSLIRTSENETNHRRKGRDGIVQHYGSYITGMTDTPKGGKKHPIDIIQFTSVGKGRHDYKHPTKKPVKLMEYLIKTYTNENEIVLDFAMGSGTTGVACKQLNRRFIGIELDKEYFKIAEERINKAIRQYELFAAGKTIEEITQPSLMGVT